MTAEVALKGGEEITRIGERPPEDARCHPLADGEPRGVDGVRAVHRPLERHIDVPAHELRWAPELGVRLEVDDLRDAAR